MKKLKAGIIGLGRIASLYEKDKKAKKFYSCLTHAGTYSSHPEIELVAGADIDSKRRTAFKHMWKVEEVYSDYNKMLQENDLDILSICTYPKEHYEILKNSAGKVKTVFCEKPFTDNLSQIRKVISLQEKTRLKISINLYREYDKTHAQIRNLIKTGKHGTLQRVNCYYGKGIRNMGTHLIGYLLWTFGSPEKIKVLKKKKYKDTNEYTYDVYFEFKQGVPVVIQACDFTKFRIFEMDFIFQSKRIQVLDEGLSLKEWDLKKNRAETGAFEIVAKEPSDTTVGRALYSAADHLVALCRRKNIEAIVSPKKYLELQLVIEEIEKQGKRL